MVRGGKRPGEGARTGGKRARLLLVDDNADVRDSLGDLLDVAGFQVTAVESGESALDYLETRGGAEATDVIVLDFSLPGMSGADLVAAAASRAALARIPVIFVTADERARAAAAASGCECLGKPLDLDDLVAAVARRMPGG